MNQISSDEFTFRFKPRNRPSESDTKWDLFLDYFSLNFPQFDSYRNSFFLIENGIGDQVCVLGLLRAFKTHYRCKNIIVIAKQKSADLLSMYNSYDKILLQESLPSFTSTSNGRIFNVLHRPSKSYSNYGRLGPVFNAYCIPYIDQYKIGLGLPLTSLFDPPDIKLVPLKNIKADHREFSKKDVILFPFSNTWDAPPIQFWEQLAFCLSSAGFRVWTNTANKTASSPSRLKRSKQCLHPIVHNTLELSCDLPDLLSIANSVNSLIMGVSGPAWFLSHAACKKIILHPNTYVNTRLVRSSGFINQLKIQDIESLSANFPKQQFYDLSIDYSGNNAWGLDILKLTNILK